MYPLKTKVRYNQNNLALSCNTFTTVYLGNYISGNFDEGIGSHCGVDIFPVTSHDVVFACMDGVVVTAENKSANGNYVIIKHDNVLDPDDMSQKTTLFSCYLHLTEYSVTVGQLVSEGDIIGKSWNTGNVSGSTGEHLHFQIDRKEAPFHPYWPFSFAEAQAVNLGFFEAVNKWLGIENAKKFTVNPLVYLDAIEMYDNTSIKVPTIPVINPTISSVDVASIGEPVIELQEIKEEIKVVVPPVIDNSNGNYFTDVPMNHPYITAINFLKSKEIVGGNNGQFSPDATITRAELIKMVFGAAGVKLVTDGKNYFSDVDPHSWQAPFANTAKVNKVIGGYPDGTFRPNNSITRAEAFKIIINTFHPDNLDIVSFAVFGDVATNEWYAPYANFAKINELIHFSANKFEPNKYINRGEVANAIYVCMKM